MVSRIVFIHHHIFKNAGTSFNYALKQFFQESYCEYDLPDSKLVTNDYLDRFIINNPSIKAISSHHACFPTPQGKNYHTVSSILLRQPLARIESIYKFERQQNASTQGAIQAKKLNFKEYILWRLKATPNMLCNYQTHYCSRNKQSQINEIVDQDSLKIAIQNLEQCLVVGTVEKYPIFLQQIEYRLKHFYPQINLKYHYLNITNQNTPQTTNVKNIQDNLKVKLGEKLVKILEQKNQLDYELYAAVEEIMVKKRS